MSQNTKKREWKTDTTAKAIVHFNQMQEVARQLVEAVKLWSCEAVNWQGQWLSWHEGDQSWNLPSDKQFEPVWTSLNQFKPV